MSEDDWMRLAHDVPLWKGTGPAQKRARHIASQNFEGRPQVETKGEEGNEPVKDSNNNVWHGAHERDVHAERKCRCLEQEVRDHI